MAWHFSEVCELGTWGIGAKHVTRFWFLVCYCLFLLVFQANYLCFAFEVQLAVLTSEVGLPRRTGRIVWQEKLPELFGETGVSRTICFSILGLLLINTMNVYCFSFLFDQTVSCLIKQHLVWSNSVLFDQTASCLIKQCLVWSNSILFDQTASCLIKQCLVWSNSILFGQTASCLIKQCLVWSNSVLYDQTVSCMIKQQIT